MTTKNKILVAVGVALVLVFWVLGGIGFASHLDVSVAKGLVISALATPMAIITAGIVIVM